MDVFLCERCGFSRKAWGWFWVAFFNSIVLAALMLAPSTWKSAFDGKAEVQGIELPDLQQTLIVAPRSCYSGLPNAQIEPSSRASASRLGQQTSLITALPFAAPRHGITQFPSGPMKLLHWRESEFVTLSHLCWCLTLPSSHDH